MDDELAQQMIEGLPEEALPDQMEVEPTGDQGAVRLGDMITIGVGESSMQVRVTGITEEGHFEVTPIGYSPNLHADEQILVTREEIAAIDTPVE